MTDIVDQKTRSRMMSGIKNANTRPEILIRKKLFALGFRYRLHLADYPGKPDIFLKKYNAAIFVHGCFWHGHDCQYFKWPSTRVQFWREKIVANKDRDARTVKKLQDKGIRVCVIHECAIREAKYEVDALTQAVASWLRSGRKHLELP